MFIIGLGTNAVATIPSNVTNIASISTTVYEMMDGSLCYCLAGKTCSMPAAIYWDVVEQMGNVYSINRNKTLVRGMQTDCFVSNGLFSSTLECYYDSSCLELLVSNTTAFTPLNATIPSKFSIDSRVQDLMNELMLEEIDSSYSLEMYYPHCAPLTCMYSYTHRVELLTIITSIIGLVGGLNTTLILIIPLIADIMLIIKRKLFVSSTNELVQAAPGRIILISYTTIHEASKKKVCHP
ncbi:unnamed protein product [Rotaria sp. Silwood1]|nr:unnamed protein product [Rotaria sp. Silwood1]CAF5028435.1 unnamed protein product [Rotaria sp. Silwood1]